MTEIQPKDLAEIQTYLTEKDATSLAVKKAQIELLHWAIKVTASGHTYMMIRQIFAEKIQELEGTKQ